MRYGRRSRYPGNGPFREIPPYQRPGYLYGGSVRGFTGTDPSKCARFPWLARWWWADPYEEDSKEVSDLPSSEKEFLEAQLGYLNKELEQIKNRLEELSHPENK